MIRGTTRLVAHVGDPIAPIQSPMIYNPYFERQNIDVVVVPMGVSREDFPGTLHAVLRLTNALGAIITMPHKRSMIGLLDACSPRVSVAGSCNAVVRRPDGTLFGDLFDGLGFVAGLRRNGFQITGARCLVIGAGGAGSAIAIALAAAGAGELTIHDIAPEHTATLIARLHEHHPQVDVRAGSNDPSGFDLVINASPLGMTVGDDLPIDVSRLDATSFVAEVVMMPDATPLLVAARRRGCRTQPGIDMLFEQIPLYLEFFGLGPATSDELRAVAKLTRT
ncbi:MAG: shikimate dehydrogenase [Deltaproteobacteria bacterium]|nr:MAG: shikimate dehydrogenase [Deltaproteobacteria bacterium]